MKKIILLVASVLAAIQSIANRNVEGTNSNSLILSPSDGIYNHGSHVSHASHASHYSMMFATKTDSVNNVSKEHINMVRTSLAKMYNCDIESVEIRHIFISANSEIYKSHNGYRENPFITIYTENNEERSLYISYRIMSKIENGFRHMLEGGEYLIPITNPENSIFYYIKDQFPPNKCEIGDLADWMKSLIQKYYE